LGGHKKGIIAGGGVSAVVYSGASGLLAAHVPVCSLEVHLEFFPVLCGWVKLAPSAARKVVAACFGYDGVGPAENGGLRGIVVPFGCK
jgi:hypothetical protein